MNDIENQVKQAQHQLALCNDYIAAKRELGCNVSEAETLRDLAVAELEAGKPHGTRKFLAQARKVLREAIPSPDFPYMEPSSYDGILSELPKNGVKLDKACDMTEYEDKVLGGWLGKNIGGALGAPVEGWKRSKILETHGEVWDYIVKPPSTLNDDTAYEIVAIHAMQKYGLNFTADQLALEWVEHLPRAYTAEAVAIGNLKAGIFPPASGYVDNPYSEWIGAQMKGEIWGFIAPGKPDLAAKYAYIDGIIAHEKNGVYGEIYDAVLISAAFVESDMRKLLEIGLSYVPKHSRLTKVVKDSIAICDSSDNWKEAADKLDESWIGKYHQVHTFPNLGYVIIGMLFGEGDFERVTCITNMCGLDTDCTAGQAAAIVGTVIGARNIPAKWKDPIGDKFETYVIGWENLETSRIAKQTCELGRQLLGQA